MFISHILNYAVIVILHSTILQSTFVEMTDIFVVDYGFGSSQTFVIFQASKAPQSAVLLCYLHSRIVFQK